MNNDQPGAGVFVWGILFSIPIWGLIYLTIKLIF